MPGASGGLLRCSAEIQRKVIEHVSKYGNDTSFTEFFWKKCEPHAYEVKRYPLYVNVLRLMKQGKSNAEIACMTGVNEQSVGRWTRFEQRPKLAHYLSLYLQLGEPRQSWVWLSLNNTSGHAVPLGPLIQVPKEISEWDDVAYVLAQLEPLEVPADGLTREYLFGFLVGMIIGDAAKSRSKHWHRHLGLGLRKKYGTNVKIGDFMCVCARAFGLRMHRTADLTKPGHKPHGFYYWVSQASPLVDWIFNAVLGLEDGERTTYDSVKMEWVVDSPQEFRRGLVQGIGESDGSVNVASQTVEFWIGPNWDFFKQVLLTFGVKSFRNREALSVTRSQVVKLGAIPPFSPVLKTVRYLRFEKLANAGHVGHGKRIPSDIRTFIMQSPPGHSVPEVSERVLDRFGVTLGFEAVQRWIRRGLESAVHAYSDTEAT